MNSTAADRAQHPRDGGHPQIFPDGGARRSACEHPAMYGMNMLDGSRFQR
jgi:hypothetical protein